MELPRQEFWSGFPFPSPGDLPNPGIKPGSPALKADSLPSEPLGNAGIREMWASLVAQLVKNPPALQEIACNAGDLGSIPGLGRSPGEGNGNPLQSCLKNPMGLNHPSGK